MVPKPKSGMGYRIRGKVFSRNLVYFAEYPYPLGLQFHIMDNHSGYPASGSLYNLLRHSPLEISISKYNRKKSDQ